MLAVRFGQVGSVHGPLYENHQDQVTEQEQEEDHLGQELEKDLVIVALDDLVPQAEAHAERHVKDAKYQGDLHLVGVEKPDLVGSHRPGRIDPERIGVPEILTGILRVHHYQGAHGDVALVLAKGEVFGRPVRAKYVKRF